MRSIVSGIAAPQDGSRPPIVAAMEPDGAQAAAARVGASLKLRCPRGWRFPA